MSPDHPLQNLFAAALFRTVNIMKQDAYYATKNKFWYIHTADNDTEMRINYYYMQ